MKRSHLSGEREQWSVNCLTIPIRGFSNRSVGGKRCLSCLSCPRPRGPQGGRILNSLTCAFQEGKQLEPLVEIEHPSLLITAVSVQQETRTSELLKPLLQLAPAVVTRELKDLD